MEARKTEVSAEKKQELIKEIIEEEPRVEIEKPKATVGSTRARKVWTIKVVDFSVISIKDAHEWTAAFADAIEFRAGVIGKVDVVYHHEVTAPVFLV